MKTDVQNAPVFVQTDAGVGIALHVIPNARKSEIIGWHGGRLKIKIKAPPVDGKANEEILVFFSRYLGLPKNRVSLIRGKQSKSKTLLVQGLGIEVLKARIESEL